MTFPRTAYGFNLLVIRNVPTKVVEALEWSAWPSVIQVINKILLEFEYEFPLYQFVKTEWWVISWFVIIKGRDKSRTQITAWIYKSNASKMVRLASLCLNKHVWGGTRILSFWHPVIFISSCGFFEGTLDNKLVEAKLEFGCHLKTTVKVLPHFFTTLHLRSERRDFTAKMYPPKNKTAQFIYILNVCWLQHVLGWCSLDCSSFIPHKSNHLLDLPDVASFSVVCSI